MTLFEFSFPKEAVCTESDLYYHGDNSSVYNEEKNSLSIRAGSRLSFDSYFNSFPLVQYQRYTNLNNIRLELTLSGKATVQFCASRLVHGKVQEQILEEKKTQGSDTITFTLTDFPSESILYPVIIAEEDITLTQGSWKTDGENERAVRLSIVICTYKREEFVYRNLSSLSDSLADFAHVFVIDNGHTIESEKIKKSFVTVIQNKNLGGSGGFTRGIMETLRRKTEFTHVILMDDDIVFDPAILERTRNLLSIVKEDYRNSFMGGSMLELGRPFLQHECGAKYNWLFLTSGKNGYHLCNQKDILKNTSEEKIDYTGWWYCVIPLRAISENELPLPFFIKADDIEYSLRLSRNFITANGISVWHKAFDEKASPSLVYYSIRNRLITNTLHRPCLFFMNWILVFARYARALCKDTQRCPFITLALKDFFKGPDFLLSTDGEVLNTTLREKQKALSENHKSFVYYALNAAWNVLRFSVLFVTKRKTVQSYRTRQCELTSWDNWEKRLGM